MDPSGTFVQCDARAIGSASEGAQSSLQEVYHKVVTPGIRRMLPQQTIRMRKCDFSGFCLVHDTEGCHQIFPDHSEAGDGGEAERH